MTFLNAVPQGALGIVLPFHPYQNCKIIIFGPNKEVEGYYLTLCVWKINSKWSTRGRWLKLLLCLLQRCSEIV